MLPLASSSPQPVFVLPLSNCTAVPAVHDRGRGGAADAARVPHAHHDAIRGAPMDRRIDHAMAPLPSRCVVRGCCSRLAHDARGNRPARIRVPRPPPVLLPARDFAALAPVSSFNGSRDHVRRPRPNNPQNGVLAHALSVCLCPFYNTAIPPHTNTHTPQNANTLKHTHTPNHRTACWCTSSACASAPFSPTTVAPAPAAPCTALRATWWQACT